MKRLILAAALLTGNAPGAAAFGVAPSPLARTKLRAEVDAAAEEVAPDDYPLLPPDDDDDDAVEDTTAEATALKLRLYKLSASYDRGFGATPRARDEANDVLASLAAINPTAHAARGIDGDGLGDDDDVPLKAMWRMVWTSAFDVVSLGASPFAAPSAIYQDISNPPVATNIIDFIPRAQTILPPAIAPPSLLRAEVTTRASTREGMPNRVGLIFEGVKLQPVELLGQKVDGLPPLTVDFMWPRNLLERLAEFVPGLDKLEDLGLTGGGRDAKPDTPGYFEVDYLDDELLVIRQNAPGGVFALVKVDSCEP